MIFYCGDESTDIFFIAKGGATVTIEDTAAITYKDFRTIAPGEHFGEIGVIYGCPRTATVTSNGYSTYARLSDDSFKRLKQEIPELEHEMRSFIL